MKKVYVLLAEGFEIIEAMTPIDVLKRGNIQVVSVAVGNSKEVKSSHNITIIADTTIDNVDFSDGDMIVLPGGYPGYINLANEKVEKILKHYEANDKFIGAICGAPTVLSKFNIFNNKKVTCHNSVSDEMINHKYEKADVLVDGKLITGIGAGHSLTFAFELAKQLVSPETITSIKKGMELD